MQPLGGRAQMQGVTAGGWRIDTRKCPIIGEPHLDYFMKELDNPLTLPEILFGNSYLQLTHEATGKCIHFNALDALLSWRKENLPPLKVPVANKWQQAREEEIKKQNALVLEYDWTYTTPYTGSLSKWKGQGEEFRNPGPCPPLLLLLLLLRNPPLFAALRSIW